MKESFTILIADRNSRVRMFLMRELMAEGYRVELAASGEDLLKMVFGRDDLDLLILDPDLPGAEAASILKELIDRIPALPIVLHTHRRQDDEDLIFMENSWFTVIEKAGDSVERIKEAVGALLPTPRRAEPNTIRSVPGRRDS